MKQSTKSYILLAICTLIYFICACLVLPNYFVANDFIYYVICMIIILCFGGTFRTISRCKDFKLLVLLDILGSYLMISIVLTILVCFNVFG